MTERRIQPTVNDHSCQIHGVQYVFKVEWIAVETFCDPVLARHLLNIECVAVPGNDDAPARLHLLVWISDLSELRPLLDDALKYHLAEQGIEAAPVRTHGTPGERWHDVLRDRLAAIRKRFRGVQADALTGVSSRARAAGRPGAA